MEFKCLCNKVFGVHKGMSNYVYISTPLDCDYYGEGLIKALDFLRKEEHFDIDMMMYFVNGDSHDASWCETYELIDYEKWNKFLEEKGRDTSPYVLPPKFNGYNLFEEINLEEWSKYHNDELGEGAIRYIFATKNSFSEKDAKYIIKIYQQEIKDKHIVIAAERIETIEDASIIVDTF